MKKRIIYILLYCFLLSAIFSCKNSEQRKEETFEPRWNENYERANEKTEVSKREQSRDSSQKFAQQIDGFLMMPFDLEAFKASKNGSRSTAVNLKPYHYKPAKNGKAWQFMGFEPKEADAHGVHHEATGYLGSNENKKVLV